MKDSEPDVNEAVESSTTADVDTASSAEQAPVATEKTQKEVNPRANREALIAKMTAKEQDPADVDPPADEAEDSETGSEAPETTPADSAEAAPEGKVDDDLTPEDKHYSANAQNRIRTLAKKVKEQEGLAGFGGSIIDRAQKAGIPPKTFVDWVDLGADLYSNPQAHVAKLIGIAKQLGWQEPKQAEIDTSSIEVLLKSLESDLEVSDKAASAIREKLKTTKPVVQAPPVQAAQPAVQQQVVDHSASNAAVAEIDKIATDFQKTMTPADWKLIEPEVMKKLEEFKGSPANIWPKLFRNAAITAIAERKAKAPQKQITRTLRPTTTSVVNDSAPKSNRAKLLQKYT